MMRILSHRGLWHAPEKRNTLAAFEASCHAGFGIETDLRDRLGELVVSHDPPDAHAPSLQDYLQSVEKATTRPLLHAINIKSDGLAQPLSAAMSRFSQPWFVFDMSTPDMMAHLRAGHRVYARMSEFEVLSDRLFGRIAGVWLDAFESTWYSLHTIECLLTQGLEVCVVSPELHRRDEVSQLWDHLRALRLMSGLSLCTDWPEAAANHFGIAEAS